MLREMDKFTGILLLIQLNPIPIFGAKKITVHVPYDRKIFIESSIKMVSAQCLLLFLLHTYMCVYTLIIWLPFQPTTEPKVDNIRMAGYMEKLPVKSNQKKVHVCSNEKSCHEYSSLIPQPHPPSDPPSLQGTSSPGEMSTPWRQEFHTDDINQCLCNKFTGLIAKCTISTLSDATFFARPPHAVNYFTDTCILIDICRFYLSGYTN